MTESTAPDYASIRQELGLSCDEMAAMLRLDGKGRADKVREFERGKREPSGPVRLIYETLGRDAEPEWWWPDNSMENDE